MLTTFASCETWTSQLSLLTSVPQKSWGILPALWAVLALQRMAVFLLLSWTVSSLIVMLA